MEKEPIILIADDMDEAELDKFRYATDAHIKSVPRELFDSMLETLEVHDARVRRGRPQRSIADVGCPTCSTFPGHQEWCPTK